MGTLSRWNSLWIVSSLTVPLLAGCGDGGGSERACIRDGEAEVCAEREDSGNVILTGRALKPGSHLDVTTEEAGSVPHPVGANGEPKGLIVLIGATSSSPVEIRVSAVAATDVALDGTLTIE